MKNVLLLAMLFLSLNLFAQTGVFYVAAKSGLSIREKPGANEKVIDKIPYGTKITLPQDDSEWISVRTEGMFGFWRKVKYNNKTGYIVGSYLFPVPPPKSTVKDMKSYFAQITVPFGAKLVVKSGTMNNIEEGGWEIDKQLYKNGAEHHEFHGYEYGSDTYYLTDFNLQQAFLLLRMIPEFSSVFGEKDEFPTEDKTIKKGEKEYQIKVEKEMLTEEPFFKKISVSYEDGAVYSFEMYLVDNQVVIFFGSGV